MKKAALLGFTSLLLASSLTAGGPSKSEQITTTPTSGKTYNLSYAEGMEQIAALNKTAYDEDAWIFDGSVWHDVGFPASPGRVSIDTDVMEETIKKSKDVVLYFVHNHPPSPCGKISPPSDMDIYHLGGYRDIEAKYDKTLIGCVVDTKGTWFYYGLHDVDRKLFNSDKYVELVEDFQVCVYSNKTATESSYESLKEGAREMGVYLDFLPNSK